MKAQLLDDEILEQLIFLSEDEPGFWRELVNVFAEEGPEMLAQLAAYLQARNDVLLRKTAHRLIGAAGNLGAVYLVELLREVERLSKEQAYETIAGVLNEIDGVFQATLNELRARENQFSISS